MEANDQSYKEAGKHFNKVHLAQTFKNTREGTFECHLKSAEAKSPIFVFSSAFAFVSF